MALLEKMARNNCKGKNARLEKSRRPLQIQLRRLAV
jgi:hypothetical protein